MRDTHQGIPRVRVFLSQLGMASRALTLLGRHAGTPLSVRPSRSLKRKGTKYTAEENFARLDGERVGVCTLGEHVEDGSAGSKREAARDGQRERRRAVGRGCEWGVLSVLAGCVVDKDRASLTAGGRSASRCRSGLARHRLRLGRHCRHAARDSRSDVASVADRTADRRRRLAHEAADATFSGTGSRRARGARARDGRGCSRRSAADGLTLTVSMRCRNEEMAMCLTEVTVAATSESPTQEVAASAPLATAYSQQRLVIRCEQVSTSKQTEVALSQAPSAPATADVAAPAPASAHVLAAVSAPAAVPASVVASAAPASTPVPAAASWLSREGCRIRCRQLLSGG